MSTRRKPQRGDPRRSVSGSGIKVEAVHRYHQELPDPVPGVHLWTTVGVFAVADPFAAQHHLDLENLLTIEGPGCLHCGATAGSPDGVGPCPGDVL